MLKIDKHIKDHRLETYELVKDKTIIYLDTKYWLILRDLNISTDPKKRILLDQLLELSDSGKCIFPISEISFWEFMKQSDINTLKETALLVDRLSKGISMINADERRFVEFSYFFCKNTNRFTHELNELVWTKLSLIIGYNFIASLETESEQKSFFDFVSKATLYEVISTIYHDKEIIKPFDFKDDTKSLNENKEKHANDNSSFKQMFLSELGGYLDLFESNFQDVIYHIYCKENNLITDESEMVTMDKNNKFKYLIYNGFRLGKLTSELPIFRIVPELFAAARWNRDRKFSDGNDTMDFLHASFALPYCDYFFTENELKTMIIQRKLDKLYDCQVESNQKMILDIIGKIK